MDLRRIVPPYLPFSGLFALPPARLLRQLDAHAKKCGTEAKRNAFPTSSSISSSIVKGR